MQASNAKLGKANQSIKIFAQFGISNSQPKPVARKAQTNLCWTFFAGGHPG